MPILLRPVQASDAEVIAKIYAPSVESTAFTFETEIPGRDEFRARIQKLDGIFPWFVAEENGSVVGYAYASPHRERAAYRWSVEVSVYVDSQHLKKGIARLLYVRLIESLKLQGFYNAYAGITLPNEPSVKLHESFGFKAIGTYQNIGFKLGQWHDVGWWGLTLQTPALHPQEPLPTSALRKITD
jgi:L-amino acid N-acyltransferase YncA